MTPPNCAHGPGTSHRMQSADSCQGIQEERINRSRSVTQKDADFHEIQSRVEEGLREA